MIRVSVTAALACALALVSGLTASAVTIFQSGSAVLTSGGVYHVAVCGPVPAGVARCHAHIVTDQTGRPLFNRFVHNVMERTAVSNVVPAGWGPMALNLRYDLSVSASYPVGVGSSKTIVAVVDAFGYPNAEADLQVYRNTYHLPTCTTANGCFTKYNQHGEKGNYPVANVNWSQETGLDLDMVSAMCPHCKIILIEAANASPMNLALSVRRAGVLGAHVISNSYGGAEADTEIANQYYNQPSVAITASTGDDGYAAGPAFPATSQYVTAVGGTSLTFSPATGFSEKAWAKGGSGCSGVYPKPTWQASITLCTRRMEADVSAVADPATGVAVYVPENATTSGWAVFGGTSVAAPLVAGVYGANGGAVTRGSLYGAGLKFWDVTAGSNGTCGGAYFCTAGKGYDGPTGLGTPTGTAGF